MERAIGGESQSSSSDSAAGGRPRRERAIAALVELAAADGYASVDVARVAARAGITAADFHRCFADLDDCLLAAFDGGAERVLAQARDAAEAAVARNAAGAAVDGAANPANGGDAAKDGPGSPAELVLRSMVGAVARCVGAEPKLARVCLVESAALGPAAAERRQRLLDGFRRQLEEQLARVGPAPRPYASELIVGGIYEVVQLRVRNGEAGQLAELAPSLAAVWVPLLRAEAG